MSMLAILLVLAAPPILIAVQVRAAPCRLCRTAAASPLAGLLLLLAAGPALSGLGVPMPVQYMAGAAVWAVLSGVLPRALSRWLHTGPPCGSESACAVVEASRHQNKPERPPEAATGPRTRQAAPALHHRNEDA